MEYANSGNLREYLKSHSLSWEEESQKNQKYQLAFDITNGLYYLHKENILHRDLVSYFFLY
jgi:serine/threonine protein kinase